MRRYANLLLAVALIAVAGAASSAAQAQGRPEVCFYEHVGFQGRAYCIQVGERVDFVGRANDQFSSVRVPRGVEALMCEDANFRGRCITLRHSEPDFVRLGFNDRASSISAQWERRDDHDRRDWDRNDWNRPGPNWDRRQDPRHYDDRRYDDRRRDDRRGDDRRGDDRRGGQVCFYEHSSYRGQSYCVPVGAPVKYVGDAFNKKASSMRSPHGVLVTVCDEKDFRGKCKGFGENIDYLGNDWNDRIVSFSSKY